MFVPGLEGSALMNLLLRNCLGLLVAVFLLVQATPSLPGAAVRAQSPDPGSTVQAQEGMATTPYLVSAAYPYWRAPSFPPGDLPFEHVDQVAHFGVRPGANGALDVPISFTMPELIEGAHRAGCKVVLGVGGANSHNAFAPMAADAIHRQTFVQNLTDFVLAQGYDGANIDWEFPGTAADRQNLSALMAELRASFDATDQELGLSIAVTSNEGRGQWIDVDAITPLVDHYIVMTFGYYGAWAPQSGHNAPLYPSLGQGDSRSVDQSLRYWADSRGVPRSKILMGVASFGLWFDSEGLHQPFSASGKADYRDIKPLIGAGYTRHWDSEAQVPYLTYDHGPGIWSYDDPQSAGLKRDYALANGFGGVAVWDVTMDLVAGEHEILKALALEPTAVKWRLYLPLTLSNQQMQKARVADPGISTLAVPSTLNKEQR
jgi:chitinase